MTRCSLSPYGHTGKFPDKHSEYTDDDTTTFAYPKEITNLERNKN